MWDTVMAPAPIANTVNAFDNSVSKPSGGSSGAMIVALVIIATVDDPCAVFKMAANRKGRKTPT